MSKTDEGGSENQPLKEEGQEAPEESESMESEKADNKDKSESESSQDSSESGSESEAEEEEEEVKPDEFLSTEDRQEELKALRQEVFKGKAVDKAEEADLEKYDALPPKAVNIIDKLPAEERKEKWEDALEDFPEAKELLSSSDIEGWKDKDERRQEKKKVAVAAQDPVTNAAKGNIEVVLEALSALTEEEEKKKLANDSLIAAAEFGHADLVKSMLEKGEELGVDANAESRLDGRTALICATQRNQLEVIDVLLQFKAELEVSDEDGYTPTAPCCAEG